jgi:hypothetical protein
MPLPNNFTRRSVKSRENIRSRRPSDSVPGAPATVEFGGFIDSMQHCENLVDSRPAELDGGLRALIAEPRLIDLCRSRRTHNVGPHHPAVVLEIDERNLSPNQPRAVLFEAARQPAIPSGRDGLGPPVLDGLKRTRGLKEDADVLRRQHILVEGELAAGDLPRAVD